MSTQNKRCPCGSGKKYRNCCGKVSKVVSDVTLPDKLKIADALYTSGQIDRARSLYEEIVKTSPGNKHAIFKLSLIATHQRDYKKSEILLKKLIAREPDNLVYYSNLGYVLHENNNPVEAVSVLSKAISIRADFPDVFLNRANSLTVLGKIDKAIADYKSVLELNPGAGHARANMAYAMNFSQSVREEELFEVHRNYAHSIESGVKKIVYVNTRVKDRKLKIGYLSSDFRRHSVSYFIEPVLDHHDRDKFEVFCYYNHVIEDSTTRHFIGVCDQWRNIARLHDKEVVHQILKDEIDILIDLSGYTANNRLQVLAVKPAPIQCEWLGYPNTTGLASMDYWLCDAIVNPPGLTEKFYTEKLLRLPGCFICFKPPVDAPEPVDPPCLKNGYVTFGSFNNFAKVSEDVMSRWAEILGAVPDSHLMLKSSCLGGQSQRQVVSRFFESRGIQKERIQLEGYESSRMRHLEMYSEIDIALDTFPYNGTTTTCEAMWMGVPVVTLSGDSHRSRVGKTLLENVSVGELVGETGGEYVQIAVELSRDTSRLSSYRSDLRDTVEKSCLADAVTFTASLESAFRSVWEEWCDVNTDCTG